MPPGAFGRGSSPFFEFGRLRRGRQGGVGGWVRERGGGVEANWNTLNLNHQGKTIRTLDMSQEDRSYGT